MTDKHVGPVKTFAFFAIGFLATLLVGFAFYSYYPTTHDGNINRIIVLLCSCLSTALIFAVPALVPHRLRAKMLLSVLTGVLFFISVASLVILAVRQASLTTIIVVYGLELVVYLMAVYGISIRKNI